MDYGHCPPKKQFATNRGMWSFTAALADGQSFVLSIVSFLLLDRWVLLATFDGKSVVSRGEER